MEKVDNFKKFEIKTPKGTRDYNPLEMSIREKTFETIKKVFKRHGGVTIDTPIFELRDILTGKYGEDSKLIYDIADQGGELCALRYDLTVPFARYLAMNSNIKQIKRYQIGKVYRRDQPQLTKGRYREFYQCDYDIAGIYDPMIPDSEIIRIIYEILNNLNIGDFTIKINHRKLIDGIFEVSGVPEEKFRTICSSIDKLDKTPWEEIRNELIYEKGLSEEIADNINLYVTLKGDSNLIEKLSEDDKLIGNEKIKEGLQDMKLLFTYLEAFSVSDKVSFDLSLARGLDYYTGVIYEAIINKSNIGSVAGGGRYDNLVGMFDQKNRKLPCVGLSIGVERIFTILENKIKKEKEEIRANEIDIYICSIGENNIVYIMSLVSEMWDNDIKVEFSYKKKSKFLNQIEYCEKNKIPYAIIIGEDEIRDGNVKLKNVEKRDDKGIIISRDKIIDEIKIILEKK